MQYPFDEVHATLPLPQTQELLLLMVPSLLPQTGEELHRFKEDVQYPFAEVHTALPHMQGLVLLIVPLMNKQIWPETQMQ